VWLEGGSARGAAGVADGVVAGGEVVVTILGIACSSAISSGVIVTVSPFTPLSGVFQKWQVAAAECAADAVSDMSPNVRYLPGTL
jgi:hypothetical protein